MNEDVKRRPVQRLHHQPMIFNALQKSRCCRHQRIGATGLICRVSSLWDIGERLRAARLVVTSGNFDLLLLCLERFASLGPTELAAFATGLKAARLSLPPLPGEKRP
jgi:hypothetical protein